MTDIGEDLRRPTPQEDAAEPLHAWRMQERRLLAWIRDSHPDEPEVWATWENVQRVRHGEPPVRSQRR